MPDEDKNPRGPLVMDFRIVFYHYNFCNLAVVEILIVCLLSSDMGMEAGFNFITSVM